MLLLKRERIPKSLALFPGLLLALTVAAAQSGDRDRWQQVSEIFKAMAIGPGSVVADVGAGDGFLTTRLASAVGEKGHVYAEDISERALQRLRRRVAGDRLANVTVISGSADDPRLPAGQLDAAVILNAYHEMEKHEDMLRHIRDALKPGGRLVIAERTPSASEETRAQQVAGHRLGAPFIAEELPRAGFTVLETLENFARTPEGGRYFMVVGRRTE